ncbi:MAG TPA: response regulator transcription factor [Polyangia bacterium]|jgi:DNA-binding NarL/FixJ family response regulator
MAYDIGIVEDDTKVRETLARLLADDHGLRVVFEAGTAEEALERLEESPADLVIVDLGLPGMDGIEFLRRAAVASPATQCMVLTVYADEQRLFDALRAGALGYLTKDTPPDAIAAAITDLRQGGSPMSPGIARLVVKAFGRPAAPVAEVPGVEIVLTAREREILSFLAQGYTYQNVAARLGLSTHTIHSHIRNIYRKLQVNSRSEAVYEALRRKLVDV